MKKPVKISLICISIFIAIVLLAIGVFFLMIEPNFKLFDSTELNMDLLTSCSRTITVLDKDDVPIADTLYDNNKIYVSIDELPEYVPNAFIAIEDKRFYSHDGIDYKRMVAALFQNIKSCSFREGASTITQQLIKNTHLSNEKTLKRKFGEIRLARALERVYSKPEILESYLNILYFGAGIRGLGTASRVMFGIPASDLTIAQSAALASIINNPTKYSPYNNIDNLNKRKELVLKAMYDQGYITDAQYGAALKEEITFNKNKQNQFISALIKSACEDLDCTEKQLFNMNVTIKTFYDRSITQSARTALSDFKQKYDIDCTARILILDNTTGGVICDETNTNGYINPRRSPASAIKPFLSYAPALESGLNPLYQIADEPTTFGDYAPNNYKNVYRGYISLKDCLIYSSNIGAVKLLQQTGIEKSKNTARTFGLRFDDSDNSLSIALGGMNQGVTLEELANAYRTLANGGVYSKSSYVKSIYADNKKISETRKTSLRAVGDDTAYILTDILTECAKSGTAKKLKNTGIIAAKTGTNGDANGNHDCYCIAFTPQLTIAVWYGSNDAPIKNSVTGATCCEAVAQICKNDAVRTDIAFTMPDSVSYYEVDGLELATTHNVYLADPVLPKRYRLRTLLSKRYLPIKNSIDIIDFYDKIIWDEQ